jgi:hypothetical protein
MSCETGQERGIKGMGHYLNKTSNLDKQDLCDLVEKKYNFYLMDCLLKC